MNENVITTVSFPEQKHPLSFFVTLKHEENIQKSRFQAARAGCKSHVNLISLRNNHVNHVTM